MAHGNAEDERRASQSSGRGLAASSEGSARAVDPPPRAKSASPAGRCGVLEPNPPRSGHHRSEADSSKPPDRQAPQAPIRGLGIAPAHRLPSVDLGAEPAHRYRHRQPSKPFHTQGEAASTTEKSIPSDPSHHPFADFENPTSVYTRATPKIRSFTIFRNLPALPSYFELPKVLCKWKAWNREVIMRKRPVILTVVGIAVIAAIVIGFSLKNRASDELTVEIEPVARRTVTQTVNATGKIQPVTQVNISADVSAKITSLSVEEGDWVEKGQLLVELDRERYVAALESSEANLRVAQANVVLARENMIKAQKDHERTSQLFEKNLESQATLDTTYAGAQVEKARVEAARDQVAQAQASLKQAQDALSKTSMYAPISGTISRLNKEVGEIALGSQFQEDIIMELSNLAGMEALVDVDENDIVLVALNDSSEIEVDALQDIRLAGEVTEIASSARISAQGTTDQKTEFEVKIGITDPAPSLRPGMTASADIVTDVHEDAVSVKIQCVAVRTLEQLGATGEVEGESRFEPDDEGFVQVVWVFSDGIAEARQVTTGIQGDDFIEILSGLDEGEQVVVGSYRAISRDLTDGAAVTVNSEEPAKG
ncbi:MAG: hypothetical protein DRJ65_20885 [Acidobacteria bacterium]|nr:MAG: hypothetical protein DRJ65_20885 [Acidobacteriota bacterium]